MTSELIDADAIQYQKYADVLRFHRIAAEYSKQSPVIIAKEVSA